MKILLLGCNGQVGQELQETLAPLGTVVAWGRQQFDLARLEGAKEAILQQAPETIVNAAAYTAVDRAEGEPELANIVNGEALQPIATAASELGATLVHVSTDYVFAGDAGVPYLETDTPHPLGIYGSSKLRGEEMVRACCDRHCIVRTAWVYGANGSGNFVKTMLRLGKDRRQLNVVADQVGSPTWSKDLARAIAACIPKLGEETYGTYHYTNSGVASWYDFAVAIFEEARHRTPLEIERVLPISTAEYPTPARRPHYSVLSTAKMTRLLEEPPPHWRQSLRHMLTELLADPDFSALPTPS